MLTMMETYRSQNLNVYIRFDVESDVLMQHRLIN